MGRKLFGLVAALLMLLAPAVPVPAQDMTDPQAEKRLALAERMHEIWPVRERMDNAIESFARRMPPYERPHFVKAMRLSMDYAVIEQESIETMAELFTVEELEAMAAYYGSEAGKSAESRREAYQEAIEPVISRMLDRALLEYRVGPLE